MEEKKTNSQLVGVNVIAQLFGLTERRVQQLTQAGVLAATKDGRYNKYDILKTVQRYIVYLQGKAAEKDEGRDIETEHRASEAEASLKESKAGMAAMELKELESKMHRSEDVEAMTTDLIMIITQRLNELPDRLAGIHKTGTAAEASSAIQKEAHAILWDLSRYQFNPEEYEERKAAYEAKALGTGGTPPTKRGGKAYDYGKKIRHTRQDPDVAQGTTPREGRDQRAVDSTFLYTSNLQASGSR